MDEEVEPAEAAQDGLHEPSRRARLPEVGREGLGASAQGAERRHRLRRGGRVAPVVDGDVVSRAGGPFGEGPTQAAGSSGDEGDGSHGRSVSPAPVARVLNL